MFLYNIWLVGLAGYCVHYGWDMSLAAENKYSKKKEKQKIPTGKKTHET